MDTKIFLRVESRLNGLGPYMAQKFTINVAGQDEPYNVYESLVTYLYGTHNPSRRHPVPGLVIRSKIDENTLFCFDDINQLEKWFDPTDLEKFSNFMGGAMDYAIAIYASDEYYIEDEQCIMDRRHSKLLTWIEPSMIAENNRDTFGQKYLSVVLDNYLNGVFED